jgi:hypothetical protein
MVTASMYGMGRLVLVSLHIPPTVFETFLTQFRDTKLSSAASKQDLGTGDSNEVPPSWHRKIQNSERQYIEYNKHDRCTHLYPSETFPVH